MLLILVFTKIIELNFLGIKKKKKKNIRERAAKLENSERKERSYSNENIEIDGGLILNFSQNDIDG